MISESRKDQFIFEQLEVYQYAVMLYSKVLKIRLGSATSDIAIARQMHRAVLSISLNIAEGSGKTGLRDRRNFLVIARGSLYESVAIFNALKIKKTIDQDDYDDLYRIALSISKMTRVMIKNIDDKLVRKS